MVRGMIAEFLTAMCLLAATPTTQPVTLLPEILPSERYLFTHPSWLDWWLIPNFRDAQAAGRELPITGVFVLYVDGYERDGPQHAGRIGKAVHDLGLKYVHGIRHSHQRLVDINKPLTRWWQESAVFRLNMVRWDFLVLDMEPYYSGGRRYHAITQWPELALACRPWSESLIAKELYVYPAHHTFAHSLAVMGAASRRVKVFALDHTTYRGLDIFNGDASGLATYMMKRHALWQGQGFEYVPGFYLYWLSDKEVMRQAAGHRRVWFFPRTAAHPDHLHKFGTPAWKPRK